MERERSQEHSGPRQTTNLRIARAELRMAAAKFGAVANSRHLDRVRLAAAEEALERAADAFAAAKHEAAAVVALDAGTVQR